MSLFRARKSVTSLKESLQRAKDNLNRREEASKEASVTSSSHLGEQLEKITGPLSEPDGTATTSEIGREKLGKGYMSTPEFEALKEQEKKDDFERGLCMAKIEDELRRSEESQVTSRVETGQLPSDLDKMRAYSDLTGKAGVTGIMRYNDNDRNSDESSELSPPPTTSYGGSIAAFPPRAIPQDPFLTPRASVGIIACWYIQLEEYVSQHTTEEEGRDVGMPETPNRSHTPKLLLSNIDNAMTEVEWRDEQHYMMPTK